MTATEELRRLLDGRGVEHTDLGGMTEWTNGRGRICRAYTRNEPLTVDIAMLAVPPAQAVEATLGCEQTVRDLERLARDLYALLTAPVPYTPAEVASRMAGMAYAKLRMSELGLEVDE
jgi:hypothetical protein